VRVVAGKYKRRALIAPEGTHITRPTADRAKESLFNILSPHLHEAVVLDLFAGSGALGIEALSRGARKAIFIEQHQDAFRCLMENLSKLNIPKQEFFAVCVPVEKFLQPAFRKTLHGWNEAEFAASTTVVIADPPYSSSWYNHSVEDLESSELCNTECLAVIEMSSRQDTIIRPKPPWGRVDERIYGAARIEFWKRLNEEIAHEEPPTS
jgi:16S rRNA (guanine966-N2)-methyltransferase